MKQVPDVGLGMIPDPSAAPGWSSDPMASQLQMATAGGAASAFALGGMGSTALLGGACDMTAAAASGSMATTPQAALLMQQAMMMQQMQQVMQYNAYLIAAQQQQQQQGVGMIRAKEEPSVAVQTPSLTSTMVGGMVPLDALTMQKQQQQGMFAGDGVGSLPSPFFPSQLQQQQEQHQHQFMMQQQQQMQQMMCMQMQQMQQMQQQQHAYQQQHVQQQHQQVSQGGGGVGAGNEIQSVGDNQIQAFMQHHSSH